MNRPMSSAPGAAPARGPLRARARALVVLLYAAVSAVFFVLVQLPPMLLTRSGDFSIWLARRLWSPAGLWLAGTRVEVATPRRFPVGPAIFASNHESVLDIWILFLTIPRNLRFVAKRELFRIPVFGWYLWMAKYVLVDRRDHAQAVAALRRAGEIIRSGISLMVFPEGTRSRDGRIQPFKKGPFVVAMEAGVPVVPVAIVGASALNPKGRLEIVPGRVRVGFGEPVDPRRFADRDALLREVRRRIIALHRSLGGLGGDERDAVAARGLEGASR
jgi:1-acyl-sn-glycerol-3-phosphate acyltransferase